MHARFRGMTLQTLLKRHGITTIKELTERTGLSRQQNWRLWHGLDGVGKATAKRLHARLGLPFEELMQVDPVPAVKRPRPGPPRPRGRPRKAPPAAAALTPLEESNRVLEVQIRATDASGLTKRQIANRLNKAGVPVGTETGRWDVDTVLAWLLDPGHVLDGGHA
jgi:transcriptional regulator with XRE-family HTH domain